MQFGVFHPTFKTVGGAEKLIFAQLQYFFEHGLRPELVTFEFPVEKWPGIAGQLAIRVVQKYNWLDFLFGLGYASKYVRRGCRASKILEKYDVVMAHNFPASPMLGNSQIKALKVWYCNEARRSIHLRKTNPCIMSHLSMASGDNKSLACSWLGHRLKQYERDMNRNSECRSKYLYDLDGVNKLDYICANSKYCSRNIKEIYGRSADKVVYPTVNFSEMETNRSGLYRDVRRILVHSRIEFMKNIDTVIRGFKLFSDKSPVRAELHIVGKGEAREELGLLVESLSIKDTVKFHGYLSDEDLRQIYRICDVMALLPIDEPFGMVFPEAASKGLLLVGPDHGGPMEILEGGKLGWAVDAFSPERLAETLHEIWSLRDFEVDRLREKADAAVRSRYGIETIGPQLLEVVSGI